MHFGRPGEAPGRQNASKNDAKKTLEKHEKKGRECTQVTRAFPPGGRGVPLRSLRAQAPGTRNGSNAPRDQTKSYDHSSSCHGGAVADIYIYIYILFFFLSVYIYIYILNIHRYI